MSKDPKAVRGADDAEGDALTPERAAEIVEALRAGELEVPVGADDLVGALRLVAAERDDALGRYQRALADFTNFQRRADQNERDARQRGAAEVVNGVLGIIDHFDLALGLNPATTTAEQVIGGVGMIRSELLRVLGMHGVTPVQPAPGDEFEPARHEAVQRVPTAEVAPGRVARMISPGYVLGGRLLRPARVAVAADPGEMAAEPGGEG